MKMKKERDFYQVSLKLLLKNNEGDILALKGVDNGSFAGYYDLPGGRIDVDEFKTDFLEILKREAEEEIGNSDFKINPNPVAIGRHLISGLLPLNKTGKDIHILNVIFVAEYFGEDVKISDEHTDHKWLNLKEIELEKYFISGILAGIKMYLGK